MHKCPNALESALRIQITWDMRITIITQSLVRGRPRPRYQLATGLMRWPKNFGELNQRRRAGAIGLPHWAVGAPFQVHRTAFSKATTFTSPLNFIEGRAAATLDCPEVETQQCHSAAQKRVVFIAHYEFRWSPSVTRLHEVLPRVLDNAGANTAFAH